MGSLQLLLPTQRTCQRVCCTTIRIACIPYTRQTQYSSHLRRRNIYPMSASPQVLPSVRPYLHVFLHTHRHLLPVRHHAPQLSRSCIRPPHRHRVYRLLLSFSPSYPHTHAASRYVAVRCSPLRFSTTGSTNHTRNTAPKQTPRDRVVRGLVTCRVAVPRPSGRVPDFVPEPAVCETVRGDNADGGDNGSASGFVVPVLIAQAGVHGG